MSAYLVMSLAASHRLRDTDVQVPDGRIRWVEWRRDTVPQIAYQGGPPGRFVVLKDGPDPRGAQWIADTLSALIDLIHGPSGTSLSTVEIPREWTERGHVVFDDLERLDAWRFAYLHDHAWWPTDDPIREALELLPAVLASARGRPDRGLPAALMYYKTSTAEFAFLGDGITWALGDEGDQAPDSAYERARIEQSFHNAFKALEGLIGGEPPKDDRRFRDRLRTVGVDPGAEFGFPGRRVGPIIETLKNMREIRDQRAAHAGRTTARTRDITFFELMEAQYAVAAAIGQATLAARGSTGEPA